MTRLRVTVMPKAGVLDPEGKAIGHALGSLGFAGVGATLWALERGVNVRMSVSDDLSPMLGVGAFISSSKGRSDEGGAGGRRGG